MASGAAQAALGPQQALAGVALVDLQWMWLELWLDPQQTSGEVTPLAMAASLAAALAAQVPQLTLAGVALALLIGEHRQAPCWTALMSSVLLGY